MRPYANEVISLLHLTEELNSSDFTVNMYNALTPTFQVQIAICSAINFLTWGTLVIVDLIPLVLYNLMMQAYQLQQNSIIHKLITNLHV